MRSIPLQRYAGAVFAGGVYGAPSLARFRPSRRSLIILAIAGVLLAMFLGAIDAPAAFVLAAGPVADVSDLREKALAKLLEARQLEEPDGTVSAENFRRQKALMAEFHELDGRVRAAAVMNDELHAYTQPAGIRTLDGQAVPLHGGRGGSAPAGRRETAIAGPSWGAEVARVAYQGGVLAPGSVAVPISVRSEPITEARRIRFVSELIPQDDAPVGRFGYNRQTTRTNNAAAIPDGAKKPTSIYTLTRVDDRVRTIAHLSEPLSRFQLEDAEQLRSFVDDELRYGLDLELDDQVINGDATASGTVDNMRGILETVGIQTQAVDSDGLVTTRKAVTKLETVDLNPTGFVMSPADWEAIELEAMSQYAANPTMSPTDGILRRLWGIPVVVSNSMAAGTALLGAFASSAILYVTGGVRVDWSENVYDPDALGEGVGASDFERNMLRFRAERRANIAVTRPLGFVEIALA